MDKGIRRKTRQLVKRKRCHVCGSPILPGEEVLAGPDMWFCPRCVVGLTKWGTEHV
jgi:hypothetical protein